MLTCKFLLVQICTLACGFVLCANLHVESANFHVKMRICTDANFHSCKFSLGVQICSGVDLHSDCKFARQMCLCSRLVVAFLPPFPREREVGLAEKRQSRRKGGARVSHSGPAVCVSLRSGGVEGGGVRGEQREERRRGARGARGAKGAG